MTRDTDERGKLALADLPMYWQGRANALRILNDKRDIPDAHTSGSAQVYAECAEELRAALRAPAGHAEREALENLLDAARLMPRTTPKPGGASTVHDYKIEAAYIWGLDRMCKAAEAALSNAPAPSEGVRDSELHPDTQNLVQKLSWALEDKLARAQKKYGYSNGWLTDSWESECREQLKRHLQKGDPLDVVAYAAFMWARNWSTAKPSATRPADTEDQGSEP